MRSFLFILVAAFSLNAQNYFSQPVWLQAVGAAPEAEETPFDPSNIPGYTSFVSFIADDIVGQTGANALTNWPDLSGNSRNLGSINSASSTNATVETSSLSPKKCVLFGKTNGKTERMRTPNFADSGQFEIVILLCRTNDTAQPWIWMDGAETTYFQDRSGNPLMVFRAGSTATHALTITNRWYVLGLIASGTNSTTSEIWTNNVAVTTSLNTGTLGISGGLAIGGEWSTGAGSYATTLIAEFHGYSTKLSTGARDGLYNYFKTNYSAANLP